MTKLSTTTLPLRDSLTARLNPVRTARSVRMSSPTPRPWFPSSGFVTTGNPIRLAAATASSSVRTTSLLGTGRPAEPSSEFVIFLSPAMSTARALVRDVIVARIRCWYFPCPSCTSDCSFSRMNGMSRLAASSRIACVDGPNCRRSASRISRSSSAGKSNPGSAFTRWFTSRTASRPASRPTYSSAYP